MPPRFLSYLISEIPLCKISSISLRNIILIEPTHLKSLVYKFKMAALVGVKIKGWYYVNQFKGPYLGAFLEILDFVITNSLYDNELQNMIINGQIIIWLMTYHPYRINYINWCGCDTELLLSFIDIRNKIINLYHNTSHIPTSVTTALKMKPFTPIVKYLDDMVKLNRLFPLETYCLMPIEYTPSIVDTISSALKLGWSIYKPCLVGPQNRLYDSLASTTRLLHLLFEHKALYMFGVELSNMYAHKGEAQRIFFLVKEAFHEYKFCNSFRGYKDNYLRMEIDHNPNRYFLWVEATGWDMFTML